MNVIVQDTWPATVSQMATSVLGEVSNCESPEPIWEIMAWKLWSKGMPVEVFRLSEGDENFQTAI